MKEYPYDLILGLFKLWPLKMDGQLDNFTDRLALKEQIKGVQSLTLFRFLEKAWTSQKPQRYRLSNRYVIISVSIRVHIVKQHCLWGVSTASFLVLTPGATVGSCRLYVYFDEFD